MKKTLYALTLTLPAFCACISTIDGGTALTGIASAGSTNSSTVPGGSTGASSASGGSANSAGANGSLSSAPIDPSANGLPCEVTALLQHYCVGCHSSPPSGGAPQALTRYENLAATATTDPTQKVGALSVSLMKSGVMPPKPAAVPTAAEQATLEAWVSAGMPRAACAVAIDAGGGAMNPYDTPLKCTSAINWTRGDRGSSAMHPGVACIQCHAMSGEAPQYTIAGTVFPSAHEPDDCNGVAASSSGALSVLITEANGTTHTLAVNSVGNFYYEGALSTPYKAQVNAGSAVRVMTHTQTSGDCNSCHTVNGTSTVTGAANAPGRIMSP